MYCVYITTYTGDKLPKFYVGSTSIEKIKKGYNGSVASKQWGNIWNREIKEMPHLFDTQIISEHETRKDALEAELEFQLIQNVVESSEWVNKSLAQPDGFFGMDVSGKNNPMYGSNRTGEKHKGGENISSALQEFFKSDKSSNHRKTSSDRLKLQNPTQDPETLAKIKETWKNNDRGVGAKNGMYGKTGKLLGKFLYNNGIITKAFNENEQPEGWIKGRVKK
jgi:hypothetical protein